MISTDSGRPSVLNTVALRTLGLPGKTGTMSVDGHTLHVMYDTKHEDTIHVYACNTETEPNLCCVS